LDEVDEKGYYLIIKKGMDILNHIETIGHENGHFLELLNSKHLIYRLLNSEDLGYIEEDFACLCGFWALHRAGFDITSLYPKDYQGNLLQRENGVKLKLIDVIKFNKTASKH
jgi:hypothetical protein